MTDSRLGPRRTPRQERARRTVDRILVAAARVFDDVGYAGASTNDIAREAGISIGSLYQYFSHKDAILLELARRHVDDVVLAVDAFSAALDVGAQDLDVILRDLVGVLMAQHHLDGLHMLIAHRAPRTPELECELARARDRFIGMAEQLLVPRINDAGRRRLAAEMVVAIMDTTVHQVLLSAATDDDRTVVMGLMNAALVALLDTAGIADLVEPAHAAQSRHCEVGAAVWHVR